MIPTIPYLEQKFDEFNQLFFKNALVRPRLELTQARSYRGQCIYTRQRQSDGTEEYTNFRIRISVSDDRPECEVEDTLLHEMIHYYIGVNDMLDDAPHGRLFRALMQDINRRYGRHIVVSHRQTAASAPATNDPSAPAYQSRRRSATCVVAVLNLKDGRCGFKVLPRTIHTIVAFYNTVRRSSDFKSIELYLTSHPYFGGYPRSGASYFHFVSDSNFHDYLKEAITIRCNGTDIAF